MNEHLKKTSYLDWSFYHKFKFNNNQVLQFNYTDLDVKSITLQPCINFLIKYFGISCYVEIGIGTGTNLLTTCQYVEHSKRPCTVHGIALYNVPVEKINMLGYEDILISRNLAADNVYPFASISDVSIEDNVFNHLDKGRSALIVLNQIKDLKIEDILEYYKIAGGNSILLISKHIFRDNNDNVINYIRSYQMKYMELKDAIIVFKDIDRGRTDRFFTEFEYSYLKPLEFISRYLVDKAKCHQKIARSPDLFNLNFIKPHKNKHFFSVVGLFRNESMALKEWIEHYIKFGADHFYLVDNKSTDHYYEILQPYIERGLVTLYSCEQEKYQLGMLRELTNILKNETEWVGAFDLDEFIYPQHSGLITDAIKKFDNYEAIIIPWLVFGSNEHIKQPESIVAGFTKRRKYDGNESLTKSIIRTNSINILTQHVSWTKKNDHVLCNGQVTRGMPTRIKLFEKDIPGMELLNNHYVLQSVEYFEKVKCNRPEVAENCTTVKGIDYFNEVDALSNEIVDERLARKMKDVR